MALKEILRDLPGLSAPASSPEDAGIQGMGSFWKVMGSSKRGIPVWLEDYALVRDLNTGPKMEPNILARRFQVLPDFGLWCLGSPS